jgi:hypothetical protein
MARSDDLRIDLPRLFVREFSASIDLDREAVQRLTVLLDTKEEDIQDGIYVYHYSRSRKRHELSAHFDRDERGFIRALHVLYDLDPLNYPDSLPFEDLIRELGKEKLRVQVRCIPVFTFPADRWNPVFMLPWPILQGDPSAPFDEVVGLRVEKKSGGTSIWSATIDRQGDSLIVNPRYTSAGILDSGIFLAALNRGIEIAGRLSKPREE